MTPHPDPVDPEFIKTLSTDIHGIYAVQVAHLTPQKIEAEFRKAVRVPKLVADPGFMDNLMFLVRKKEVVRLKPDVEQVLRNHHLAATAEISTLKTLYALDDQSARKLVDSVLAQRLRTELPKAESLAQAPYLQVADRIGGSATRAVLESALSETAGRLSQAEQTTPGDHVRIGRLDKVNTRLISAADTLSTKAKILALPEAERDIALLRLYLRRAGNLGFWAFEELRRSRSPEMAGRIQNFLRHDLDSVLPPAGLTPDDRARRLEQSRAQAMLVLQPPVSGGLDWEDVLDRD